MSWTRCDRWGRYSRTGLITTMLYHSQLSQGKTKHLQKFWFWILIFAHGNTHFQPITWALCHETLYRNRKANRNGDIGIHVILWKTVVLRTWFFISHKQEYAGIVREFDSCSDTRSFILFIIMMLYALLHFIYKLFLCRNVILSVNKTDSLSK